MLVHSEGDIKFCLLNKYNTPLCLYMRNTEEEIEEISKKINYLNTLLPRVRKVRVSKVMKRNPLY